jgi:hypothetical protein
VVGLREPIGSLTILIKYWSDIGVRCLYDFILRHIVSRYFKSIQSVLQYIYDSCIPATDLSSSHCHFKSNMRSPLHGLIPFLALYCNCQLNSIPLLQSSYPGRLASRNSTLIYVATANFGNLLYNYFVRTTQKTQPLYCSEGVVMASLHSNVCLRNHCRENMFTVLLPNNIRLFWLHYSGFRASCYTVIWREKRSPPRYLHLTGTSSLQHTPLKATRDWFGHMW